MCKGMPVQVPAQGASAASGGGPLQMPAQEAKAPSAGACPCRSSGFLEPLLALLPWHAAAASKRLHRLCGRPRPQSTVGTVLVWQAAAASKRLHRLFDRPRPQATVGTVLVWQATARLVRQATARLVRQACSKAQATAWLVRKGRS